MPTLTVMRILLVATYDLGHQPLSVAAPAGRLRDAGHEVRCRDLAVQDWEPEDIEWADRVAFSVPMHTATMIAQKLIDEIRAQRSDLPVAAYGLYGHVLADSVDRALSGETDEVLRAWVEGDTETQVVYRDRITSSLPARDLLPPLSEYAHLIANGTEVPVAYVEASHGCSHKCRHCPVPVVYDGRIRIVDKESVLADIAQQVRAGARHVTFGDPDFLNGAQHSLRIVRTMHQRFPELTFDCTVKVEHVIEHSDIWAEFAASGCLFAVSAFESVDEATLMRLDKGHTVADMVRATQILRDHSIAVRPSWMPFTPWTTPDQVRNLLEFVAQNDLIGNVDPVQYTIRLLLPPGSLLLAHPDLDAHLGDYQPERRSWSWQSADPAADALQKELAELVEQKTAAGDSAIDIYNSIRTACALPALVINPEAFTTVPRLSEAWFCCAEPTSAQLAPITFSKT